jgi:hypothetical protein
MRENNSGSTFREQYGNAVDDRVAAGAGGAADRARDDAEREGLMADGADEPG